MWVPQIYFLLSQPESSVSGGGMIIRYGVMEWPSSSCVVAVTASKPSTNYGTR